MKQIALVFLAAAAAAVLAAPAPSVNPIQVVQARHRQFRAMGAAMKGLTDQLKSNPPSMIKIVQYAGALDALGPHVGEWFPLGTGPEDNVATHAKAGVWKNPDLFRRDAQALAASTHNLAQMAKAGSAPAIRAAAVRVGHACQTCHTAFREPED